METWKAFFNGPNRRDIENSTPRDITMKLTKISDKENLEIIQRIKGHIIDKATKIKIIADYFLKTMKTRRHEARFLKY